MSGIFMALAGIEGSGKTSLAKALAERGEREKLSVFRTAEPTRGEKGREARSVLRGERPGTAALGLQRLFVEDRHDHTEKELKFALRDHDLVVCDRHWLCTMAYGVSEGIDVQTLYDLHVEIMGPDFLRPDMTLFLDLPAAVALKRVKERGGEREYFDEFQKMDRIRSSYIKLTRNFRYVGHVVVIDAFAPFEKVEAAAWAAVADFLRIAPFKP